MVYANDIIKIFGYYKQSLSVLMNNQKVHVFLNRDYEIDYECASCTNSIINLENIKTKHVKDFNMLLKSGADKKLVDAMVIYKTVHSWFLPLLKKERQVIFYRYIDIEDGYGESYRNIGKRLNISQVAVFKICSGAMKKIEKIAR